VNLYSGTVTFLFSDVEGSTDLLKRLGEGAYATVLEQHRRIVREAFSGRDGREIDTQGDAFFYAFPTAPGALAAADAATERSQTMTAEAQEATKAVEDAKRAVENASKELEALFSEPVR